MSNQAGAECSPFQDKEQSMLRLLLATLAVVALSVAPLLAADDKATKDTHTPKHTLATIA